MGYYSNLLLRCYEASGKDAQIGIKSDPLLTAQAVEMAEKSAFSTSQRELIHQVEANSRRLHSRGCKCFTCNYVSEIGEG